MLFSHTKQVWGASGWYLLALLPYWLSELLVAGYQLHRFHSHWSHGPDLPLDTQSVVTWTRIVLAFALLLIDSWILFQVLSPPVAFRLNLIRNFGVRTGTSGGWRLI
jgi:hypothetical protein